jgi:hypothetical protein
MVGSPGIGGIGGKHHTLATLSVTTSSAGFGPPKAK